MALVFVWFIAPRVTSFASADVHVELSQHRDVTSALQESRDPV